ncbi:MAG: hypothetical protein ACI81V_001430 [Lentimonas sp.]|jgi:hypothetical protein
MKANVLILSLLALIAGLFSGCTTPVAIDPMSGQDQTARYQAGYFYAPLEFNSGQVFRVTIKEMDAIGYFRTGELHGDSAISIYARKVGDEKVTVKISQIAPGQSQIRIRMGTLGNLSESQILFAKIHNALK